ncbi:hypothetical protein AB7M17_002819 [Bradyrhizobium sp. USDA 377]
MCDALEGGREASKRLWPEIEDWALPWSRKGIAGALVRAHAGGGLARRQEHVSEQSKGLPPIRRVHAASDACI